MQVQRRTARARPRSRAQRCGHSLANSPPSRCHPICYVTCLFRAFNIPTAHVPRQTNAVPAGRRDAALSHTALSSMHSLQWRRRPLTPAAVAWGFWATESQACMHVRSVNSWADQNACSGAYSMRYWRRAVQGAVARRGMVSADAVNVDPGVRRAAVAVRGRVGGVPFEVTRTRTASSSAPLHCPYALFCVGCLPSDEQSNVARIGIKPCSIWHVIVLLGVAPLHLTFRL